MGTEEGLSAGTLFFSNLFTGNGFGKEKRFNRFRKNLHLYAFCRDGFVVVDCNLIAVTCFKQPPTILYATCRDMVLVVDVHRDGARGVCMELAY